MADFYHSLLSVTTGRKETEKRIMNKEEPDWGFPGQSNFFSKASVGQTHFKISNKKNKKMR
jgi:hypothetical protein